MMVRIGNAVPAFTLFMAADEEPMRGVTVRVFNRNKSSGRKLRTSYRGACRAIVGRFCLEFGRESGFRGHGARWLEIPRLSIHGGSEGASIALAGDFIDSATDGLHAVRDDKRGVFAGDVMSVFHIVGPHSWRHGIFARGRNNARGD